MAKPSFNPEQLNTVLFVEQLETNASFSPDDRYLFFTSGDDIYWGSAKIIEDMKPKE